MPAAAQPQGEWVVDRRDIWLVTIVTVIGFALTVTEVQLLTLGAWAPGFRDRWMPLLVLAVLIILRHLNLMMAMLPHLNKGMLALLAWCFLTAAWAPAPGYVITQSISITELSLIGLAFVLAAWNADRFADLLTYTVTVLLLLSVGFALTLPEYAIHTEDSISLAGSWKGITFQKNQLGQLASIGIILWFYRLLTRRSHWVMALGGVLLSMALVLQSRSNTSLMLSLLTCVVLLIILRPTLDIGWFGRRLLYGGLMVLVPLSGYLTVRTSTFGIIGAQFGKGSNFSGRAPIWDLMMQEIAKHPFLGYGFSSFWQGPAAGSGHIIAQLQWPVPSGHNGYVDITNELGLVGLFLFLLFMALHARALFKLAHFDRSRFGLQVALMLYVVLANFSESGWFRPMEITHMLGMMCSLEVSRQVFIHSLMQRGDAHAPLQAAHPPPAPVLAQAATQRVMR